MGDLVIKFQKRTGLQFKAITPNVGSFKNFLRIFPDIFQVLEKYGN